MLELSLNFVVLFLLVVTAIAVVNISNLLTSTILLTIFSFLMAAEYLILGAPDVAITEAAVGAGISTILFLLALSLTGDSERKAKGNQLVPILIVLVTTFALIYATFGMPPFAVHDNPAQLHVAPYYLTQSYGDIAIPNVVTSILASYRGFDTLGETAVIFTAAMCVLLLLEKQRRKK